MSNFDEDFIIDSPGWHFAKGCADVFLFISCRRKRPCRRARRSGYHRARSDSAGRSSPALHADDRLGEMRGRQRHQHLLVRHAAIAPLRKARQRQAGLAGLQRPPPGIGAGGLADHAPFELLVAGILQPVDQDDHLAGRRVDQANIRRIEPAAGRAGSPPAPDIGRTERHRAPPGACARPRRSRARRRHRFRPRAISRPAARARSRRGIARRRDRPPVMPTVQPSREAMLTIWSVV